MWQFGIGSLSSLRPPVFCAVLVRTRDVQNVFCLYEGHQCYLCSRLNILQWHVLFCAGMESCNCHEWKIAVGILSFCLISVIALVGVTGAAVGCKKCCKKRNTRRSGRMHARCMNEVGYYNGNYSKFFVVLGHDAHACRPVLCFHGCLVVVC